MTVIDIKTHPPSQLLLENRRFQRLLLPFRAITAIPPLRFVRGTQNPLAVPSPAAQNVQIERHRESKSPLPRSAENQIPISNRKTFVPKRPNLILSSQSPRPAPSSRAAVSVGQSTQIPHSSGPHGSRTTRRGQLVPAIKPKQRCQIMPSRDILLPPHLMTKVWIGATAIALSSVAIMCFWPRNPQPSIMTPDGSVIRFEAVTYGTDLFVYGNLFERTWGKVMKGRGINFLGWRLHGPYVATQQVPVLPQTVCLHFLVERAKGGRVHFSGSSQKGQSINGVDIHFVGNTNVALRSTALSGGGVSPRIELARIYLLPVYFSDQITNSSSFQVVASTPGNSVELGKFEIPPFPKFKPTQ